MTLLASEAALSLPDEHLGAHPVATFYAAHRGVIVTLQVVGLIAIAVRLWTARDGSARSQPPSRCTA